MPYIKEISIEVKKSMNFQTYTAGEVIAINEDEKLTTEDITELRNASRARCRKAVMEEVALDKKRV